MPQFIITLTIEKGAMTCAACSATINRTLKQLLQSRWRYVDYAVCEFETNQAVISINLPYKDHANRIAQQLKDEVDKFFKVTGHSISSEDNENEPKISLPIYSSSWKTFFYTTATSLPPLILGGVMMAAEDQEWIAKSDHDYQFAINLTAGIVATLVTGWSGYHYFTSALKKLFSSDKLAGGMDYLISLGSFSALFYSFLLTFHAPFFNDEEKHETFFSLPLVVLGLLKLSLGVQNFLRGKTTRSINLLNASCQTLPKTAHVIQIPEQEEKSEEIDIINQGLAKEETGEERSVHTIKIGTHIIVLPGETIPLDAILKGSENAPIQQDFYGTCTTAEFKPESIVLAGSIHRGQHPIRLVTKTLAADNYITKGLTTSRRANNTENIFLEQVTRYFFPVILAIALISGAGWAIAYPEHALPYFARTFLSVIFGACPCSLGLILMLPNIAIFLAFKFGLLLSPEALNAHTMTHLFLDKNKTLTQGEYLVETVEKLILSDEKPSYYLSLATILELAIPEVNRTAEAAAIIAHTLQDPSFNRTEYRCGPFINNARNPYRGGKATINEAEVVLGNRLLMADLGIEITSECEQKASQYEAASKLPLFLAVNNRICALIILKAKEEHEQKLRPLTLEAIRRLRELGLKLIVLTGDSQANTSALVQTISAFSPGAPATERSTLLSPALPTIEIQSECDPSKKMEVIENYQGSGHRVGFVGDGINDEKALNKADFPFVIGQNVGVKITSKMTVLNDSLWGMVQTLELSRLCYNMTRIATTMTFAIYGVSLLFSTGLLYPATKMLLHPMISGAIMATSSLFAAATLLVFQLYGNYRLNLPYEKLSSHCSFFSRKWQRSAPQDSGLGLDAIEKQRATV